MLSGGTDSEIVPTRATEAVAASGVTHRLLEFGQVSSLEEAAEAQGVTPGQVMKSMVVRLEDGSYRIVVVPGDRRIAWKKFRSHVGVKRTSMPDADEAFDVTGYRRGTITPFGADGIDGVLVDAAAMGHDVIAIGGGRSGTTIHLAPSDLVAAVGAEVADVTDPV